MKKLLVPFVAAVMLFGLTVAAPRAEATGFFYTCPQALQSKASTCTAVDTTVNVLDRTTGTVITWHYNTRVGMGHWTYDWSGKCGVNGDPYVWAVWWLDTYNVKHWAVIGDWYLFTGYIRDWGPQFSDWTATRTYNPDMQAASNGTGYCNGSAYANLDIGG